MKSKAISDKKQKNTLIKKIKAAVIELNNVKSGEVISRDFDELLKELN